MNISWHLLFNQLQNHPELLEEGLDEERLMLSSQTALPPLSEDKETQAIHRLQQILGNSGFQKLVAQRQAFMGVNSGRDQPEKLPEVAPPTDSDLPVTQPDNNTVEKQTEAPSPVNDPPANDPAVNDPPANDQQVNDQQVIAEAQVEAVADKVVKEPDQHVRQNLLLQQFQNALPTPALPVWKALADLYDVLAPLKQVGIVATLVKRVQQLPAARQKQFVKLLQDLPDGLLKTAFVAALSAQLFSLMPDATQDNPPDIPEE